MIPPVTPDESLWPCGIAPTPTLQSLWPVHVGSRLSLDAPGQLLTPKEAELLTVPLNDSVEHIAELNDALNDLEF